MGFFGLVILKTLFCKIQILEVVQMLEDSLTRLTVVQAVMKLIPALKLPLIWKFDLLEFCDKKFSPINSELCVDNAHTKILKLILCIHCVGKYNA